MLIQQTRLVRRFERWLANPKVEVRVLLKPFVIAMHHSLSHQTASIVLDCTQAGRCCRCLIAGLVYQQTVLPLAWQSLNGKKGHVTGEFQRALLAKLYEQLGGQYRQVIILGDAEFSHAPLIHWFEDKPI